MPSSIDSDDYPEDQDFYEDDALPAPVKKGPTLRIVTKTVSPHAWRAGLKRRGNKKDAAVEKILTNAIHALRCAPAWKGVFQYDALALQIRALKPPPYATQEQKSAWTPRVWTDDDDRRTTEWLQREDILVGTEITAAAVETVALENRVWPVRDYLRGLEWDGVQRIDTWLTTFFGAEDCEYHRVVGAKWLLSAVARAMLDDAKVDTILILEGAQGIGKGRAIEALMPNRSWYTDSIKEFLSTEAARQLAGKWIIESSELEGLKGNGKSEEGVKAFLSRVIDNYRAPWGRRAQDHPRRCVFIGTTNKSEILTDVTGNRRFWPVKCTTARPDDLREVKNQLWAETYDRFSRKERMQWWLTPEETVLAKAAQEARMEADILEPKAIGLLRGVKEITIGDLSTMLFDMEAHEISMQQVARVRRILEHLKWEKHRSWIAGHYGKVVYRKDNSG